MELGWYGWGLGFVLEALMKFENLKSSKSFRNFQDFESPRCSKSFKSSKGSRNSSGLLHVDIANKTKHNEVSCHM